MKTKIRSLIAAPPGKVLIAADLSQAESWIVAYLSGSERMKKSLNQSDIHADTAVALFHSNQLDCQGIKNQYHNWKAEGKTKICQRCALKIVETERYIGKQNNHASAYGMQAIRMAEVINKQSDKPPYVTVSIAECKEYQTIWHNLYPEVTQVFQQNIRDRLQRNRTLITPYGFKRTFYGRLEEHLYKSAYAFIPQSTVCYHFAGAQQPEHPIPGGLIEIDQRLCHNDILMVNMSHDSLMLEVPTTVVDEIADQMYTLLYRPMIINGEQFTIPVDVEIGDNYGEMVSYKV